MKLQNLEKIDKYLLELREILNPVDGYTVCDAIVTSIDDDMLIDHITNMLNTMGYKENKIDQAIKIVKDIKKSINK